MEVPKTSKKPSSPYLPKGAQDFAPGSMRSMSISSTQRSNVMPAKASSMRLQRRLSQLIARTKR
ncbi:MAG: hypothetical protein ACREDP_14100, partial [Bradyrhizobium sp.]